MKSTWWIIRDEADGRYVGADPDGNRTATELWPRSWARAKRFKSLAAARAFMSAGGDPATQMPRYERVTATREAEADVRRRAST